MELQNSRSNTRYVSSGRDKWLYALRSKIYLYNHQLDRRQIPAHTMHTSTALRPCRASLAVKGAQAKPRRAAVQFQACYKQHDTQATSPWTELPTQSNYSVASKDAVLTRAEAELGEYCNRVQDAAEAKRCWETYWYLKNKHVSTMKSCSSEVHETGSPASSCDQLEKLEQVIRELEGNGNVTDLYHVLTLMKRMESSEGAHSTPTALKHTSCSLDSEVLALQQQALMYFEQADTDNDGRLDVAEFREAMSKMSTALSGQEVSQICSCLDIHGFVEKDQFVDIVTAEQTRLQNPDSDAEFLKHVTHLHGHAHDHSPSASSMW